MALRAALAVSSWHELVPFLPHLDQYSTIELLTQVLHEAFSSSGDAKEDWPAGCSRALASLLVQHQPDLAGFCSSLQQQQQQQHTLVQLLQACSSCTSAESVAALAVHVLLPQCRWLWGLVAAAGEAAACALDGGVIVPELEFLVALQNEWELDSADPARNKQVLELLAPVRCRTDAVLLEGMVSHAVRLECCIDAGVDPDAEGRLLQLTEDASRGCPAFCLAMASYHCMGLELRVVGGDGQAAALLNHLLMQVFAVLNSGGGLEPVLTPHTASLISMGSQQVMAHGAGACVSSHAAYSSVPQTQWLQAVKFGPAKGKAAACNVPSGITATLSSSGMCVHLNGFTCPFGTLIVGDTAKAYYLHHARLLLAAHGLVSRSHPWAYEQGFPGTVAKPLRACHTKVDDDGLHRWIMSTTPSRICLPLLAHWLLVLSPQLGFPLAAWEAHPVTNSSSTPAFVSSLATVVANKAFKEAAVSPAAAAAHTAGALADASTDTPTQPLAQEEAEPAAMDIDAPGAEAAGLRQRQQQWLSTVAALLTSGPNAPRKVTWGRKRARVDKAGIGRSR